MNLNTERVGFGFRWVQVQVRCRAKILLQVRTRVKPPNPYHSPPARAIPKDQSCALNCIVIRCSRNPHILLFLSRCHCRCHHCSRRLAAAMDGFLGTFRVDPQPAVDHNVHSWGVADAEAPARNADGSLKDAEEMEWPHSPSSGHRDILPDRRSEPASPEPAGITKGSATSQRGRGSKAPTKPNQVEKRKRKSAPKPRAVDRLLPPAPSVADVSSDAACTPDFCLSACFYPPNTNCYTQRCPGTILALQTRRLTGAALHLPQNAGAATTAGRARRRTTSRPSSTSASSPRPRMANLSSTRTGTRSWPACGTARSACAYLDSWPFLPFDLIYISANSKTRTGKPAQERFAGNVSTMRKHIARNLDHYTAYHDACLARGIQMNEQCVPDEEKKRQEAAKYVDHPLSCLFLCRLTVYPHRSGGKQQASIDEYTQPVQKEEEWTKEGQLQAILEFVADTDQVCYHICCRIITL
jgi:hypothetical protein